LATVRNPLAPGLYRLDLFSPTDERPDVRDGIPIFGRWRKANEHAVRVVEAATYATEPRHTCVIFEVLGRPGAFPFGQLGAPERTSQVGAGFPSFVSIVEFLLDPLGTVEASAAEAVGKFFADVSKPELQQLRAALSVTKANIAIIRATLEAVRNGTAPNPAAALAGALDLVKQSTELILHAAAAIPIDFPRNVVNRVLSDLHELGKAIEEAPRKALGFLGRAARDVVLPLETANIGGAVFALAAAWAIYTGKVTPATRNVMLVGGAVLVLGGGTLIENLLHPKAS
jgi:hypothetical protein